MRSGFLLLLRPTRRLAHVLHGPLFVDHVFRLVPSTSCQKTMLSLTSMSNVSISFHAIDTSRVTQLSFWGRTMPLSIVFSEYKDTTKAHVMTGSVLESKKPQNLFSLYYFLPRSQVLYCPDSQSHFHFQSSVIQTSRAPRAQRKPRTANCICQLSRCH